MFVPTVSILTVALFVSSVVCAQPDQAPTSGAGGSLPAPEASVSAAPVTQEPAPTSAAETPLPAAPAEVPATKPEAPAIFKAEQLDQLLAPIALYPDALLAQILMAATYPLEVVKADRWLQDPSHANLRGDRLAEAIEAETWDPSVKSLVPFPQILRIMSQELDWTEQLGNAVVVQQPDVMDAVQRLRHEAAAAGTLWSNAQQRVTTERQGIVIGARQSRIRVSADLQSSWRLRSLGHIRTIHRSILPRSTPTSVLRDVLASASAWDFLLSDRYGAGAPSIGPSVGFNWMSTGLTPSIVTGLEQQPASGAAIHPGSA